MYYYAKKDGSEFSVTYEQLRDRLNQPDLPIDTTETEEWTAYIGKDAPQDLNWDQYAVEVYPVDGVMTWEVREYDAETKAQIQAEREYYAPFNIRRHRDRLLAESDWTQGKDIPDEVSALWATYRQALRDITLQPEFPLGEIVWPQKPE